MTGFGVIVELTPQQVTDAADADPVTHLRKKGRTALRAYNGINPRDDPVALRVDLATQTPNMRLGMAADNNTFYVLAVHALADGQPGQNRFIRLYGWITGHQGKRYIRENGGAGDHVIPPLALNQMRHLEPILVP